ncbi:MAG: nucleoside diphosphate kinase regulator [Gammaproteobacteria bacterium]|jgi:regulator of nucleoside diphosphate kinase|nr:nucleoside diphosphate kinase regulator [Gammaproteobacteria bacterium]
MTEQTPIVVSSLDLDRLERIMDAGQFRHMPGIDALRREIDRATIMEPADMPAGVVTMNSRVRFVDDASGSEFELTLVYPEASGQAGTVSVLAPVGSALLGLSVGQSISWQVPGGRKLQLRILDVIYQPESEGELHR